MHSLVRKLVIIACLAKPNKQLKNPGIETRVVFLQESKLVKLCKNKLSSKQMTEHTRDAVVYRMDSFFGGENKVTW